MRRGAALAGALAVLVTTAACGGGTTTPHGALAVVVAARAGTPPPALAGRALQAEQAALRGQAYLSLVVADGAPFIAQRGPLTLTAANDVARDQQRQQYARLVDRALSAARARAPQADLLGALTLAARSVRSADGPHTVVVVDSGISTAGTVDLSRPGALDADPVEYAAQLRDARELPDLTGARVVFQGLGDTAAPQPAVDNARRAQLVALWTAIARAAGAADVVVEPAPLQGTPPAGLPPVTPVRFSAGLTCSAGTVTFSGGDVAFVPDGDAFLDRATAEATVAPIAAQLRGGRLTATLTGTTADVGDQAGRQRLSEARARAVLGLLVALGVPADHLIAIGVGSDFPGLVPDHDSAGRLVPAAAAANRTVTLQVTGGSVSCAAAGS